MSTLSDFGLRGPVREMTVTRRATGNVLVDRYRFGRDGRLTAMSRGSSAGSEWSFEGDSAGDPDDQHPGLGHVMTENVTGSAGWNIAAMRDLIVGTYGACTVTTYYNALGKAQKAEFFNSEHTVTATVHFTWGGDGQLVRVSQRPGIGLAVLAAALTRSRDTAAGHGNGAQNGEDVELLRVEYKYDEQNRMVERVSVLAALGTSRMRVTYNREGDPQSIQEDDGVAYRYVYEYDAVGNWVRRASQGPQVATDELRREFEYYV